MIQAAPKNTYCLAPMLLDFQGLLSTQPFADDMRPAEGERQQRQQLLEPLGVGDVRLFQTEAARLQAPEQRLDFPPPRIIGDGALSLALRDDDQILPTRQAHPADMPALSPEQARADEHQRLIKPAMPEQPTGLHCAPAGVGDQGVRAHPDATRDTFAPQVREPYFANKFAVG